MIRHRVLSSFAFVAVLGLCGCRSTRVVVGTEGPGAPEGIVVMGVGEASGEPDIARVDLGVQVRAASAQEATAQVNDRMRAILSAIESHGVPKKDVRTQTLSVYEERTFEPPPRPMPGEAQAGGELPSTHYVAQNILQVTVRDLDKVGTVIGSATAAGANQVHSIRLELEDPANLQERAREKAVADARAQAEQLAELAGIRLGDVVGVRAVGMTGPYPMPMGVARDEAASSVPVEPGELTVTQQVEMRFEVDDRD